MSHSKMAIFDPMAITKSYPDYREDLKRVGLVIETVG